MENTETKKIKEAEAKDDSNQYLATGLGIGTYGAATFALAGTVCPMCVVATPALLGMAIYKKIKKRKKANS